MKAHTLMLLLAMVVPTPGHATSDSLKFRDGSVLVTTIASADAWAVYLPDGSPVSLKVLSDIVTTDSTIAMSLREIYPGLPLETSASRFTIHLGGITVRNRKPVSDRGIDRFAVLASYMTNPSENIEVQFNATFRGLNSLAGQFAASSGLDYSARATYAAHVSLGAGYVKWFDPASLSVFLNCGERFTSSATQGKASSTVFFLSVYYQTRVLTDEMFASLGARYYISRVRMEDRDVPFNLNAGLGIFIR